MKRRFLLAAALLLIFLAGCADPGAGPDNSGESDPAAYDYHYDPYALPSLVEEELGESLPVYKAVVDAIENGEESVSVPDGSEYEKIIGILEDYYPPFGAVQEHVYENGSLSLRYRYARNVYLQSIESYRSAVAQIMRLALRDGDSEAARSLGVYLYVTSAFFEGSDRSVWDTLQTKAISHNGYAPVCTALLLQADIDCALVETKRGDDGSLHRLSLVRIDGAWYYLDPYGETIQSDGAGLASFGMTRKDCLEQKYKDVFDPVGFESVPDTDDERFAEFRLCGKWSFADERDQILITVETGEHLFDL